jgi:hypothetical protein
MASTMVLRAVVLNSTTEGHEECASHRWVLPKKDAPCISMVHCTISFANASGSITYGAEDVDVISTSLNGIHRFLSY